MKNNKPASLTTAEWTCIYDKLYGGFEDLGEEDSYSSEEEIDPELLTKEGYSKEDGFVVDSDEDIIDDEGEEEEEDEEGEYIPGNESEEEDVFTCWPQSHFHFKYLICIYLLLKEYKKDKNFHVFCFQGNIICLIFCKLLKIKIAIRPNSSPSGWSNNIIKKFLFSKILSLSDLIIVNSLKFKLEMQNKFNLKRYEDSLKENLTEKIIENLLLYLQGISVNKSNAR